MINLKPIPKNFLKYQDIENYKVLPYVKFPKEIFKKVWEGYPFWRVEDKFDLIYVSDCELALVHKDIYKDYKFYPLLIEENTEIDIEGWEIKYKSPENITFLNTKIVHPNAVRIGNFCIKNDKGEAVYNLAGFTSIRGSDDEDIKDIIKKIGLEDKFRNGTYEILYNGDLWKEVDVFFDWRYFLEMHIGYEELKDITIKAEETTPISEFISCLFTYEKNNKYLDYVRRIYEHISQKNNKKK